MMELFNDENGKFLEMVDAMIKEDRAEQNHIITVDNFHHQGRSKNTRKDLVQLEEDISPKVGKLKASSSFQNVLTSREYQDLESDMKKRNFVHLVQNMVVLSSMSLMPMKHANGSCQANQWSCRCC